jgi:hypothetical protein
MFAYSRPKFTVTQPEAKQHRDGSLLVYKAIPVQA